MYIVLANSLINVDPGLIIWIAVTLILFLLILSKFAWKPLLSALQEREGRIRESLESAEKAMRKAEEITRKNQDALKEAEIRAQQIRKEALEEAELLRADRMEKAKQEAHKMIEQAKNEIQQEKKKALADLRKEVTDMALQAASIILDAELDEKKNKKLVDSFIDNLPKN
ncbi:MAG: ATP synthase F0 subunit B [Balneolaceae bacterium]|jgi:F-type H+-transporting ATPase subunit b|nr:MAG: ATP synthase F0 subunit B [Balneolaceae bacterium]